MLIVKNMKTRREKQVAVKFLAGIFFILGLFSVFCVGKYANAANSDIIINEIGAYELSDHEWIEIYNKGNEAVDMNGWVFYEEGSNHGLSLYQGSDMIIDAGEYAIIADVATNFVIDYPGFSGTIIDSSWSTLSLTGELIGLRTSTNPIDSVEQFTYVGTGNFSLERANPLINDYSSNNWQTHASGNTAGAQNSNYIVSAVCGNGAIEISEECDDGNLQNGDGCSSLCVNENGFDGTVVITITPNANPVQNIGPTGADIVFQANDSGKAWIKYGKNASLESISSETAIQANIDATISLNALECNTLYYYAVYAENDSSSESDQSETATFTTLPCGISINSITMTKTTAKANNSYNNGWEWKFDLTVWDMSETKLKLMFAEWTGPATIMAGGNMQYSVDNGISWIVISANNAYPIQGADLSTIDNRTDTGRQIELLVQMKVPNGTLAGQYNSSYGILIEK